MSYQFWLSQIKVPKNDCISGLKAIAKARNFVITIVEPEEKGLPFNENRITLFVNDFEGNTLMTGWRNHLMPSLLVALSKDLNTSIESVDWNDQMGFSHYSKISNGETIVLFTHYGEFFEQLNIKFEQIIEDGKKTETSKLVLEELEYGGHGYVFDSITQNFPFWDLYDELVGEDYTAKSCTRIYLDNAVNDLEQIDTLQDGCLKNWAQLTESAKPKNTSTGFWNKLWKK